MAVTIKDIARHTGLGLATISKYLNGGNVLEKNRIKIDQAIKELDYHVNEFGRSLKTGHSGTIGVVIPELSIQFSACIISAMEDVLRQHNLGVIVCDCRTDVQREADAISFLLGKRVDGMINMPVCHSKKNLQPAIDRGIPIVLIDRVVSDCKLDAVLIDNIGAAQKACEYFIANGHRNIGIIAGPQDIFTSQQRLLGFRHAMLKNGIFPEQRFVGYGDYTVQSGYEQTIKMLEESPDMTALLVTNYDMTLGMIMACNEKNVLIGQELSIICIDNMQLCNIFHPRLEVIEQPLTEIGHQAAQLMLQRLGEEKGKQGQSTIITLPTRQVHGESVCNLLLNPV
ncbi:MAG: LacI family DNA-binding transcriptional regulator [Clostridia bacterium]|nr:LacI family DNA-binding transcriptional regulator [Clostridia bacterium]